MDTFQLVIANKNYSSWSLRPWLLMKYAGIPFEEKQIFLKKENTPSEISRYSESGRVPVLIHGTLRVWESLAICEYLAELFPDRCLWPADRQSRAVARAVSNEMHAGFQALRQHLPMNCRRRIRLANLSQEAFTDIDRIQEIWSHCRTQFGAPGPFLFGQFSIADAMYAPVVLRFLTYGVKVNKVSESYMNEMLSLAPVKQWLDESAREVESIPEYEKVQ